MCISSVGFTVATGVQWASCLIPVVCILLIETKQLKRKTGRLIGLTSFFGLNILALFLPVLIDGPTFLGIMGLSTGILYTVVLLIAEFLLYTYGGGSMLLDPVFNKFLKNKKEDKDAK